MFGHHRNALKGHGFGLDNDVKTVVVQWFKKQPREFFAGRIHLPASLSMGTILSGLSSFTRNSPQMGCISTTHIVNPLSTNIISNIWLATLSKQLSHIFKMFYSLCSLDCDFNPSLFSRAYFLGYSESKIIFEELLGD